MLLPNVTVYATHHAVQRYSQRIEPIYRRRLAEKARRGVGLPDRLREAVRWSSGGTPTVMLMDSRAVYLLVTSFKDPSKFKVVTVLNRGCLERGEPQPGEG